MHTRFCTSHTPSMRNIKILTFYKGLVSACIFATFTFSVFGIFINVIETFVLQTQSFLRATSLVLPIKVFTH